MKKISLILLAALMVVSCKNKQEFTTEQITFDTTYCLTDACHDSLRISIEVELPVTYTDQAVVKNIQTHLIERLLGADYKDLPVESAIKQYAQMAENEYKTENSIFAENIEEMEEYGSILCQEQVFTGRVHEFNNADNILVYETEQYVYMGGAHGVNTHNFYNFDAQTGNLLEEKDVFVENYQAQLTTLLQQLLVEQSEEFGSKKEMLEAGYDFDNVRPNGNFALTEQAVIYVFNPYDIAPYVFGETEIIIDKSTIEHLLR